MTRTLMVRVGEDGVHRLNCGSGSVVVASNAKVVRSTMPFSVATGFHGAAAASSLHVLGLIIIVVPTLVVVA